MDGMVRLPGGEFAMGSDDFYPEEAPARRVEVEGFWIDERPVTVTEFRRFVKATGYVTVTERPLDPAEYPDGEPMRSCRGRSCSGPHAARSTWMTSATGGPTSPGPRGSGPRDPRATRTLAGGIP